MKVYVQIHNKMYIKKNILSIHITLDNPLQNHTTFKMVIKCLIKLHLQTHFGLILICPFNALQTQMGF